MFSSSILPESFIFSGNTFSWLLFFCLMFYFTLTLDFQLLSLCHCRIDLSINLTWKWGLLASPSSHFTTLPWQLALPIHTHTLFTSHSELIVFTMPLIMLFSVLRNSFSPLHLMKFCLVLQNSPLQGALWQPRLPHSLMCLCPQPGRALRSPFSSILMSVSFFVLCYSCLLL